MTGTLRWYRSEILTPLELDGFGKFHSSGANPRCEIIENFEIHVRKIIENRQKMESPNQKHARI